MDNSGCFILGNRNTGCNHVIMEVSAGFVSIKMVPEPIIEAVVFAVCTGNCSSLGK